MYSIYICEDDREQRNIIKDFIEKNIMIEAYDMGVVFDTDSPYELLEKVKEEESSGIFFLDIDLGTKMNGIELALKIRELDEANKIIFITTHENFMFDALNQMVEAMNYIMKDSLQDIQNGIVQCLKVVNERFLSEGRNIRKVFKVKDGDIVRGIEYGEIMFFETSPANSHKIILHLENEQIEFYGAIAKIEKKDDDFIRCHNSFVVNKKNIIEINKKDRVAIMTNGEVCQLSVRMMKRLLN